MLLGRQAERGVLDRLIRETRGGHGGAIVVHGEPGIGKTALLEYTIASADGFQILRTVGNEAERELAYAALQQLTAPGLPGVEQLPEPQRDALQVAFGLVSGVAPDRLLVSLAALNLFSQLAAERPLLCIIDDTQWLDRESARALAFVARRLATEPIAFVFGARAVTDEVRGVPELLVEGLEQSTALDLLRAALPDRVDDSVLEHFVAETHGNPLALLELPKGLTPAQLAGGFALPVSVPLSGRIEASFRRRLTKLPAPSRRLLLIAAAEPTGDPVLVWRAAEQLGVDESAAAAAEVQGLLELNPRIVFRHPLVRSAVYGAASPDQRREAHRALADATDATIDPDRRAWHRAQAAARPDDRVAADLELSAGRAQARGGYAAAAAFMERSAELSVEPTQRARRALIAADAKRQAGALEAALSLAALAERGPLPEAQRAELDVLRAQVSFASDRGNEAPRLLLQAAHELESHDPVRARETYLDAITAAVFAGRLASGCTIEEVAERALAAPRPPGPVRASDLLLDGLARLIVEGPGRGTAPLQEALTVFRSDALDTDERLRWAWLAGRAAAFVWDYETWDLLTERQIQVATGAGALTVLPLTLSTRAGVHLFAGDLARAASLVEQVEAVADATDTRNARYGAVAVAAFRGGEGARELIDADGKDFASRGEGAGVTVAQWGIAALSNGLARYADAYAAAQNALENPRELWLSPWATVELIEAASRTGNADAAAPALDRLVEGTTASATAWGAAIEARSRALLSEGPGAEDLYQHALERLAPTQLGLDRARTHLLYGEWLRRARRHVDAREQLRLAHDQFTHFGMEGFAERARVELRATGEHVRKRSAETGYELTPQEARISQLVSQGATNVEIAAQLFISPSTVEYHLHKVFRKLGVRTRTQLAHRLLESRAAFDPSETGVVQRSRA